MGEGYKKMNPYEPPKLPRKKYKPPIVDWVDLFFVCMVLFVTPFITLLFIGSLVEWVKTW